MCPTWDVCLDLLSCDERQQQEQEAAEGVHDERGVSRQRVRIRGCDATTTTTMAARTRAQVSVCARDDRQRNTKAGVECTR